MYMRNQEDKCIAPIIELRNALHKIDRIIYTFDSNPIVKYISITIYLL